MRNVYIVTLSTTATLDGKAQPDQTLLSASPEYVRDGNKQGLAVFTNLKCAKNYIKRKHGFVVAALGIKRDYKIIKVSIK